jgi:hypothetical protein
MNPPLLAASDYGLVIASAFILLLFIIIGWVIVQGTRAQLSWRKAVLDGDTQVIDMLVREEVGRWKTMRPPKGVSPEVWRGVQSAELMEVEPEGVRLATTAEGRYEQVEGQRREVNSALFQGMDVAAKVADMTLYDIPNVMLPWVRVDVYSTYRDESGSSQRCILTVTADRDLADKLAWDEMTGEEVIRAFGGRYSLDDRGNPLPIDTGAPTRTDVPAVFYKDD